MHRVPEPVLAQSVRLPVGQQGWPAHGSVTFSSTTPLQLLSLPSHTSAVGPTALAQVRVPFVHAYTPGLHWPMQLATSPPGQGVPQAPPTSVAFSSTRPLQLSSMPLHT